MVLELRQNTETDQSDMTIKDLICLLFKTYLFNSGFLPEEWYSWIRILSWLDNTDEKLKMLLQLHECATLEETIS